MLPVLTVEQMRAADAATLHTVSEAVLVERAGTAVAHGVLELVRSAGGDPGIYGRRVVVLAGKGNNGADGRVAARILQRRGAAVRVIEASDAPGDAQWPACDVIIDAALGTGFRGSYDAPTPPAGALVLAVDIPSGVNGDSGEAPGRVMRADRTVTMAAWKLGLIQGDGPELSGEVCVADIGVDPAGINQSATEVQLVTDEDVARLVPLRPRQTNKWRTSVMVVAGSPGMEGAAMLCSTGAMRAGAGMVRLGVPGTEGPSGTRGGPWPTEAVRLPLPMEGWSGRVLEELERCRALVVGPGLGRDDGTQAEVRRLIERSPVAVVADADALFALGDVSKAVSVQAPLVITPHDGEFARLMAESATADRVASARRLASASGAVALLKGSLTTVAQPAGRTWLARAGTPRLATAGTGDVLSGVIGALVARGVPPFEAAALGAHAHGRAAGLGRPEGLVAGDLPDLVSEYLSMVLPHPEESAPANSASAAVAHA